MPRYHEESVSIGVVAVRAGSSELLVIERKRVIALDTRPFRPRIRGMKSSRSPATDKHRFGFLTRQWHSGSTCRPAIHFVCVRWFCMAR